MVPEDLYQAVKRQGSTFSEIVRRALTYLIAKERPNSIASLGIQYRETLENIALHSEDLQKIRQQAVQLGVQNLDDFEEKYSLFSEDEQ